jgi:hypothetical protein
MPELGKLSDMLIFIAVAVLAIIFMMWGISRRIRGKSSMTRQEAETRIPSLREQLEVRNNLQKLIVDLQDLARQINGHIDTRFCKLEVLIKEADQKIRQLEALGFGGKLPKGMSAPEPEEEKVDPERAIIYKLADAGKSSVDIARELNKNTGEIELILSLRRRGKQGIDYMISE